VQFLHSLRFKLAVTCFSFVAACLIFTSAAQDSTNTGVGSIRAEELRQKVSHIASEEFKGRGNGTPALDAAARYIADVFEKNGLKAAGDAGTYFQHFNIYSARLGRQNTLQIRLSRDSALDLKVETDFIPEFWSTSGALVGPLQILEEKRENRTDLPDLKGKIAVEFEDSIVSDDPEFPANAVEGRKLQEAGAIAVIIVQSLSDRSRRIGNLTENLREDLPVRLTSMASVDTVSYPQIPIVVLSSEIGRQILAEFKKPHAAITARLSVDLERRTHSTQNVLALIPGSDPNLKDEVMIVGGHYDHDGEAYGQIWYGADDNASGTAALLELAEAFGSGAAPPARSVLLCAWAGEEKGLLGSRYYVGHPFFPLNKTIAMFQMDMIGRNEEHGANNSQQIPEEHAAANETSLNVLGSAFAPELKTIISSMNMQTSLTLHFRYDFGAEDLMRRSDQWSFLQKGIPAIFFFTGLHPDYHTPRDTAEKINYPKLESVTKLVYLTAFQLANSQGRPHVVKTAAAGERQ
jgi:hypothetical protein